MYADWASLLTELRSNAKNQSVLSGFNYASSKSIVQAVVKDLKNSKNEEDSLKTEEHVEWTMQCLCYGLALPFTDLPLITDCVNIYCDWITCLAYHPAALATVKCIPHPLIEEPNKYFIVILNHLVNLFRPREDNVIELTTRHSNLCIRVLRNLQSICIKSQHIDHQSWIDLLKFLLTICDMLVTLPSEKDSLGNMLCNVMINVLFEVWLLCCCKGDFPGPPLWKTLQQVAYSWRHNEVLVGHWFQMNKALTLRLVAAFNQYSKADVVSYDTDEEKTMVPKDIPNGILVQCWYRFLTLIGSPANLCHPSLHHSSIHSSSIHPFDPKLSITFYKAVKCLSFVAGAFLDLQTELKEDWLTNLVTTSEGVNVRKSRVSVFIPSAKTKDIPSRLSFSESSTNKTTQPLAKPPHPKGMQACGGSVNSLLKLMGSWLFEAALVSDKEEGMEKGRGEACAVLCRMFSCARHHILPAYLCRFYAVVWRGLQPQEGKNPVMTMILLNCSDLMTLDFPGIQALVPAFLGALVYTHEKTEANTEVQRSVLKILLSIVCLPINLCHVPIIKLFKEGQEDKQEDETFGSLSGQMNDLMLRLLSKETNAVFCHMLLGAATLVLTEMSLCHDKQAAEGMDLLYKKIVDLMNERLSKSWSFELSSALSTFECLHTIASLSALKPRHRSTEEGIREDEMDELRDGMMEGVSRKVVVLVCDFVLLQCSKPAPAHSKDMHSSIVSAFHCLKIWMVEHSYLSKDSDVLHTLMQVVELGVSGSRSQQTMSEAPIYKGDKELKPVSLRVKDAAESLLNTIIDHVGSFPQETGHASLCPMIDEDYFTQKYSISHTDKHSNAENKIEEDTQKNSEKLTEIPTKTNTQTDLNSHAEAHLKTHPQTHKPPTFQYFAIDGCIILALLEPPGESGELVAVVRTSFGRRVWHMQMRHHLHQQTNLTEEEEEAPSLEKIRNNLKVDYHPPIKSSDVKSFADFLLESKPLFEDNNIPSIEDTMPQYKQQLHKLKILAKQQMKEEREFYKKQAKEYKPPPKLTVNKKPGKIDALRLFLSHFGFLSLDKLQSSNDKAMPRIVRLKGDFQEELTSLDHTPLRTALCVYVYVMNKSQYSVREILSNKHLPTSLHSTLHQMAWMVDVEVHAGFNGDVHTSWKSPRCFNRAGGSENNNNNKNNNNNNINAEEDTLYDNKNRVLYWSDVCTEVVFTVPSLHRVNEGLLFELEKHNNKNTSTTKNTTTNSNNNTSTTTTTTNDPTTTKSPPPPPPTKATKLCMATNVVVVWLERLQDHFKFPIKDMLRSQGVERDASHMIIFIHPLNNSLFKVIIKSNLARLGETGPLVSGMLLGKSSLGHMIRHTAINFARRVTVHNDNYQPPHVRRRLLIKELINKHYASLTEAEFLASLF